MLACLAEEVFVCEDGIAIHENVVCDNVTDCLGGEDEINCTSKFAGKVKHEEKLLTHLRNHVSSSTHDHM